MALNKAEKALFEALNVELALRWPTFDEPTPLDHQEIKTWIETQRCRIRQAWTFNTHTGEISLGCTSGYAHDRRNPDRTSTQGGGGPWYDTREQARRGLRWAVCRSFAQKLYQLDLG
jgi:hypothetical protein